MASNFQRNKTDYLWIACFYVLIYLFGSWWQPEQTNQTERNALREGMDIFGLKVPVYIHGAFFFVTAAAMLGLTYGLWCVIWKINPAVPTQHAAKQLEAIVVNLAFVLPAWFNILLFVFLS
jgi:hypothetical protein